jgi:hypothetical protein
MRWYDVLLMKQANAEIALKAESDHTSLRRKKREEGKKKRKFHQVDEKTLQMREKAKNTYHVEVKLIQRSWIACKMKENFV